MSGMRGWDGLDGLDGLDASLLNGWWWCMVVEWFSHSLIGWIWIGGGVLIS